MNLIKTIILEDEKEQSDQTIAFLNQYASETKKCSFDIRSFAAPMEFLSTYKHDVDLLFLDIRMPGMTGMDVAKEIRSKDPEVMIIFITSLTQYAVEGYSVSAEDYILKPLSYPEFKLKMNRALSRIQVKSGKVLMFVDKEGISKISANNIMYIETNLHRLIFHDNEGFTHVRHQSMKECEDELKESDFIRINSSYLVNLHYASKIVDGDMVLNDQTKLKISRPRMNDVSELFARFKK